MSIKGALKSIVVHVSRPTGSKPAGVSTEGYYKVVGDEVIMTKPNGEPVNIDGKQFRRRFGNKSGEFSEREVAAMLTKEIRSTLKRGWDKRPDGFGEPIHYPRDGSIV